ncbi:MAG: hypothetical protein ACREVZ_10430 [Burkholderiales bacterium]
MTIRSKNGFFRQNSGLYQTANLFSGEWFEGRNRSDDLAGEKAQIKKCLPQGTQLSPQRIPFNTPLRGTQRILCGERFF